MRFTRTHSSRGVWFREEALAELAASVKEYGVLQPLLVRRDGHDRYELIAGERRLRASRLAGLPTVPVLQARRKLVTRLPGKHASAKAMTSWCRMRSTGCAPCLPRAAILIWMMSKLHVPWFTWPTSRAPSSRNLK